MSSRHSSRVQSQVELPELDVGDLELELLKAGDVMPGSDLLSLGAENRDLDEVFWGQSTLGLQADILRRWFGWVPGVSLSSEDVGQEPWG